MTKYGSSKFTVGANSVEAQKNYERNWEAVFGAKKCGATLDLGAFAWTHCQRPAGHVGECSVDPEGPFCNEPVGSYKEAGGVTVHTSCMLHEGHEGPHVDGLVILQDGGVPGEGEAT